MKIFTRFVVKYRYQTNDIFSTTEYDALKKYTKLRLDREGFEVNYLGVGEIFEILPNPKGGDGCYRITEIRTFTDFIGNSPEDDELNRDSNECRFLVIYFVEDVK